MGGMVLETNMSEILTHIEAQNKLEKSEVILSTIIYLLHIHLLGLNTKFLHINFIGLLTAWDYFS